MPKMSPRIERFEAQQVENLESLLMDWDNEINTFSLLSDRSTRKSVADKCPTNKEIEKRKQEVFSYICIFISVLSI